MKAALIVALATMTATSANAAQLFHFSYDFGAAGDNTVVTGTFTGTGPLTDITDIGNVTMSINGTPVSVAVVSSYTGYMGLGGGNCDTCYTPSGAVVSSIPADNNFVFDNGLTGNDRAYFYIIPWDNGPGNQEATQAFLSGNYIPAYNGDFIAQNFVLSVPEPATWAMMLVGMGMVGFAMRRRAKVSVTYA